MEFFCCTSRWTAHWDTTAINGTRRIALAGKLIAQGNFHSPSIISIAFLTSLLFVGKKTQCFLFPENNINNYLACLYHNRANRCFTKACHLRYCMKVVSSTKFVEADTKPAIRRCGFPFQNMVNSVKNEYECVIGDTNCSSEYASHTSFRHPSFLWQRRAGRGRGMFSISLFHSKK